MCALARAERLFLAIISISWRQWMILWKMSIVQASILTTPFRFLWRCLWSRYLKGHSSIGNGLIEEERILQLPLCGAWKLYFQFSFGTKTQNSKEIMSSILIWKDLSPRHRCLICGGVTLIANFSRWRLCTVTSFPCTSAWDECQFVWFNFSINDKAPFMGSTKQWMN